ncbi:hypothetical protein FDG2_6312 [Candidatus Protofrankia californiensis]|uniref:Uncharacterized protein n=1 Tax=Candidatus Protofrankia californiensis TaxID=1839754 RepID=A0A1C3PGW8_9ACTN|nr:hypothetical protein FDG2_6312 [Candidatus Protofrankia californiensis]
MTIFPPSDNPWRNPHDKPFVTVRRTAHGDHAIILRPGADVRDLVSALRTLPASAIFTEHYGDVNVTLVFRPIPDAPTGGARTAPDDHGPDLTAQSIPTEAINQAPYGLPSNQFIDALYRSLAGVDLGDYDHTIIRWLAGWDTSTVTTIASLISRARRAELLTWLT